MPQIIVTAGNTAHEDGTTVTLRERVNASDFESERFAANLVERLGWAVHDATEAEQDQPEPEPEPEQRQRQRPITGNRRRTKRSEPSDSESQSHLEPVGSA
jgi:hypothetical protein